MNIQIRRPRRFTLHLTQPSRSKRLEAGIVHRERQRPLMPLMPLTLPDRQITFLMLRVIRKLRLKLAGTTLPDEATRRLALGRPRQAGSPPVPRLLPQAAHVDFDVKLGADGGKVEEALHAVEMSVAGDCGERVDGVAVAAPALVKRNAEVSVHDCPVHHAARRAVAESAL